MGVMHQGQATVSPSGALEPQNSQVFSQENRIIDLSQLSGHPRFYELIKTIVSLHSSKNHDYAQESNPLSNFYDCERAGIPAYDGILTRLSDKFARVMNLRKKEKASQTRAVNDESVVDTHMDAAVYHLLAIVLYEQEQKEKKIQDGLNEMRELSQQVQEGILNKIEFVEDDPHEVC